MLQAVTEMMEGEGPTARQQDVLDAVLRLLVEEGDRLTMTAVARRASCSKETLQNDGAHVALVGSGMNDRHAVERDRGVA